MKLRGLSLLKFSILFAIVCLLAFIFFYLENKSNIKKEPLGPSAKSDKLPSLKNLVQKNLEKMKKAQSTPPLLDQERIYTEKEIEAMTEEEFRKLLLTVESKLPQISDLKKLPSWALHRTPPPILQAGRELGLLREILKVHESFASEASFFYERCAKENTRPIPVRALCLTNLINYKKKNGIFFDKKEYPEHIVDMAKIITDI